MATLTLGALGVVYGDIGTSVLYALREVFDTGLVAFNQSNVLGILSLFFWTLTIATTTTLLAPSALAMHHTTTRLSPLNEPSQLMTMCCYGACPVQGRRPR